MLGFIFDEESEQEFEDLVAALKNGRVAAFIGTGLTGKAKPNWEALHGELRQKAGLPPRDFDASYAPSDMSDFRDAMGGPDEFLKDVKRIFAGPEPDHPELELYKILDGTSGIGRLITTNFDELLFMTAKLRDPDPEVLVYPSFPASSARYVYLHGRAASATHLNQLVLCEDEYADAYKNDRAHVSLALANYLKNEALVFVGCSLRDPDLTAILTELKRLGQTQESPFGPRSFVIQRADADWTPEQAATQSRRILRKLGLRAIWYQHDEDHSALRKLLLQLRYAAGPVTTEPAFLETAKKLDTLGSMEAPSAQEQRELIELIRDRPPYRRYFFKNASSPAWYDILRDTGLLTSIVEPRKDLAGERQITTWDAAPYIEGVARRRPDAIHHLVLELRDTENWSVHSVLSAAATELDDDQLREVLPVLIKWQKVDPSRLSLVAYNLTTLLNHLAERGSEHELVLFDVLLDGGNS